MKLQDFIKAVFKESFVNCECHELGKVEIKVSVVGTDIYVGGDSVHATITIVPSEKKQDKLCQKTKER